MSLSFWRDENYYRAYGKHRFVCTVDGKSKNYQSIRHEILILSIVNVYSRFFLEKD